MKVKPVVFIDYHVLGIEYLNFVKKLISRIRRIKADFEVLTFQDLDSNENDDWPLETLKAIDNSLITISIIDEDYLNSISGEEEDLTEAFIRINKDKDRYYFPILYKPTNWINTKWLTKSKLYPKSSTITQLSQSEIDEFLNGLSENILGILNLDTSEESKIEDIPKSEDEGIIFISHSHKDADFAELLKLRLEKEQISSWIDNERLKIGQDWREEIDEGINNSLAVIVIITPNSKISEYVTYEWAYAWGKGKKIFPILLEQTELHPRLESLQFLNFTNRTARPWADLISSIRELTP
ncbi:MAG: toll/interleukin-1 receptor domain-containing protein [Bacteroidota bacterium]